MADHLSFLGSVLLICFIAESSCKPTCGKAFYLDAATGNCDPCSDICQHVVVQNTVDLCNDKCPGYLDAVNWRLCLTTQYYDDVVGRCEECDELCRHAQQTGRQEQCNRHCPKWTTPTVYGIGAVTVASSNVNGSTEPESHASVDNNIPLIVLCSIAGVVTVLILVTVALKTRRELSRRITHRLTKAKCTKSGTQERGQAQEEMQRLSVPETERPPPSAPVIDT
ncbi:uncharacterized protein LOC124259283 isoform X2 [Haliotis rubra]|uniref:uncharacterized protein LOC124259283 isoform X2 n=1 Tax=Haliotis rubra TaxID=36100 RepID=UPI001EE55526|nr:uncharacterized protein LOC124259283 isoform X2 [Haliotis rubra]